MICIIDVSSKRKANRGVDVVASSVVTRKNKINSWNHNLANFCQNPPKIMQKAPPSTDRAHALEPGLIDSGLGPCGLRPRSDHSAPRIPEAHSRFRATSSVDVRVGGI